jgi:hypothetical protein
MARKFLCLTMSLCLNVAAGTYKCATGTEANSDRDVFGVKMLYPTREGTRSWTSAHWDSRSYVIDARFDPNDPQGNSGKRGTGTLTVENGVLTMAGEQPRLYIYPFQGVPWRDAELTVYYMRVADDASAYAGMVAGMRSGSDGHTTMMPCDAHTYYGRMRHDGAFDFAKELKHPASSAWGQVPAQTAWQGGKLPFNQWIGWKMVGYNAGGQVKLEIYRDLTEARDGGTWEKVNETADGGGWFSRTDCPEHNPTAGRSDVRILDGGTIFVRNTNIEDARYRWISIREIQAPN